MAAVMEVLRAKVSAAMQGGPAPGTDYSGSVAAAQVQQPEFIGGPIARQFAAARQEAAGGQATGGQPMRASMADTLRTAFAVTSPDGQASVPDSVRAAYGRLQQFGL